jgi:hypothetical protein
MVQGGTRITAVASKSTSLKGFYKTEAANGLKLRCCTILNKLFMNRLSGLFHKKIHSLWNRHLACSWEWCKMWLENNETSTYPSNTILALVISFFSISVWPPCKRIPSCLTLLTKVAVSRTTRTKVSNWATMLAAVKLAKILPAYLAFLKKAVVRNQTDKKHLTTCGTY